MELVVDTGDEVDAGIVDVGGQESIQYLMSG